MKKTKKILSIILAVMMILTAVPITGLTAFAEDQEENSELLPFSQYHVMADDDSAFRYVYYYEGNNFVIKGSGLVDESGVVAGNKWYTLTITSNDPTIQISRVEAKVTDYGEAYGNVGISGGEKEETDAVENGTVVHINNIDATSFTFGDGDDVTEFGDITVYYVRTEPECEHSFKDVYINNGLTHSRKCEICGKFGPEEEHTFVKHVCACGALEIFEQSELLSYNDSHKDENNSYSYSGQKFEISDPFAGASYGMKIGNGKTTTISAKDSSLKITRIDAVICGGGNDYAGIVFSSGDKVEKGGIANGTTVHINNINASTVEITGPATGFACTMTDVTVYYTNGDIAHDYAGEYFIDGDYHSQKCTKCDEYSTPEKHTFVKGVCICGAKDLSEFVIENDVLVKYNGKGGKVIIPDGVAGIDESVFEGNDTITSVIIPEGVVSIGKNAFYGCSNLKEVTIPSTLKTARFMGTDAFDGDYLETVYCSCASNADTVEALMSKYGEFNYTQLSHNFVDGECTICGYDLDDYKEEKINEVYTFVEDEISEDCWELDSLWDVINTVESKIRDANDIDEVDEIRTQALKTLDEFIPEKYTVTANGGTLVSQKLNLEKSTKYEIATVTIKEANGIDGNGNWFVYWKDQDGKIVSTYSTYSFFVVENRTLTPVYVSPSAYETERAKGILVTDIVRAEDNGDGTATLFAEHSASKAAVGGEIAQHGVIYTTDASQSGSLTIDNDNVNKSVATKTNKALTGLFRANVDVEENDVVYARSYLVDANGNTVYGEVKTVNIGSFTTSGFDSEIITCGSFDSTLAQADEIIVSAEDVPTQEETETAPTFMSVLMSILNAVVALFQTIIALF